MFSHIVHSRFLADWKSPYVFKGFVAYLIVFCYFTDMFVFPANSPDSDQSHALL